MREKLVSVFSIGLDPCTLGSRDKNNDPFSCAKTNTKILPSRWGARVPTTSAKLTSSNILITSLLTAGRKGTSCKVNLSKNPMHCMHCAITEFKFMGPNGVLDQYFVFNQFLLILHNISSKTNIFTRFL